MSYSYFYSVSYVLFFILAVYLISYSYFYSVSYVLFLLLQCILCLILTFTVYLMSYSYFYSVSYVLFLLLQCIPYLIAISTDNDKLCHIKAEQTLNELDNRYQGFIHMKAFQGVKMSFELQTVIQKVRFLIII